MEKVIWKVRWNGRKMTLKLSHTNLPQLAKQPHKIDIKKSPFVII